MKTTFAVRLASLSAAAVLVAACGAKAPSPTAAPAAGAEAANFTVGMILVGPANDKGWNQAHYDGITEYVQKQIPGLKFEYVDKVNPADRPNVKASTLAQDLVSKGAKMIIFNSDDFKDEAAEFAKKNPEIAVIHASGDYSWKEGKNFKDIKNLANMMPEMEYGHMINGCSAALQSTMRTGSCARPRLAA